MTNYYIYSIINERSENRIMHNTHIYIFSAMYPWTEVNDLFLLHYLLILYIHTYIHSTVRMFGVSTRD